VIPNTTVVLLGSRAHSLSGDRDQRAEQEKRMDLSPTARFFPIGKSSIVALSGETGYLRNATAVIVGRWPGDCVEPPYPARAWDNR
jgi:hypothetical protein